MTKETQSAVGGVAVDVSGGDQAFARTTRAFWVGGAGALAVVMEDGSEITFSGITAGSLMPIQAKSVKQTGTDASSVVALF
jgi:hypothetical protein